MSGWTAQNIAKFSPACPIIAYSTNPAIVRRLALVWGVYPMLMNAQYDTGALFLQAARLAEEHYGLVCGDLIVISAGVPLNEPGTTNMLKVHEVGGSTGVI
jgi:pyruvate kinase